jgi:hypothetical protein
MPSNSMPSLTFNFGALMQIRSLASETNHKAEVPIPKLERAIYVFLVEVLVS